MRRTALLLLIFLGAEGAFSQLAGQSPAAPVGQAPLDLVPVNVHVVDKNGKPVTDLKQSDFTLTENGAAQQIKYFAVQALASETPSADSGPVLRTRIALTPQSHRMFVIMIGRGRLEEPTMALTGLAAFVRKLLPQDQVAVFAHDRALPFTTDHEKVAQALERCRKAHPDVDLEVDSQLGPVGMAALYGTKAISRKMQAKIDEMIHGPGAKTPAMTIGDVIDENAFRSLSIDDFMFASAQTLLDQNNLQALLEYLRRFDGEKHLLLVTEKGLDKAASVPAEQMEQEVMELANDGRTAIHTLQTGGLFAVSDAGKEMETTQQQALSFRSLRKIAEGSGGAAAIMERGGAILDRLDQATKNGYVIGYQPANTTWDGAYRQIVVRVSRPEVTVLHRHGYYRTQRPGAFDRRTQISNDRVFAAGNFRREINDIKIKAKASQGQGRGGGVLTVDGKIDLGKIKLTALEGKQVGSLDIAIFCIDSSGWSVGTHSTKLPLSLTEQEFAQYKKEGLPYSLQFPMYRGTDRIRFVVYDYGADVIGRADTKIF